MSDNGSRTATSFAWSFLEQFGSRAIQLLVQVILARILSPDTFGVLAILLVVTQICDSIAQSGLGMALIQKPDASERSYSTAWWLSLMFSLILYGIIFVAAPSIADFYSMDGIDLYLRVLGLVVVFNSANSIQRSYLQRSMDFRSIFHASTVAALISGVTGVVIALLGGKLWALVVQTLLQSIFICVFMWAQLPWKPSFVFDVRQAKELFTYGWKICVTGVLNVFYSGVSELILGRTTSTEQLGYYSQGRKYPVVAISVMTNSIANVLFPSFAEAKRDMPLLRRRLHEAITLGTFIVVAVSMWLAAIAEPVVRIVLTEKWLACTPIFMLTCAANSVLMLQLVNLRAYMALGDSSLYMRLQIVKVLGGGACIWLTAAVSHDIYVTADVTFLVNILSVIFVDMLPARRMYGYGAFDQLKDTIPTFVLGAASLSSGLFACGLIANEWIRLLVGTFAFAAVYLGGAKLLRFPQLLRLVDLSRDFVGRLLP